MDSFFASWNEFDEPPAIETFHLLFKALDIYRPANQLRVYLNFSSIYHNLSLTAMERVSRSLSAAHNFLDHFITQKAKAANLQEYYDHISSLLLLLDKNSKEALALPKIMIDRSVKIERYKSRRSKWNGFETARCIYNKALNEDFDDSELSESLDNLIDAFLKYALEDTMNCLDALFKEFDLLRTSQSVDMTTKVEQPRINRTKITGPLVITPTRIDVKSTVFRPDHNLPTMSIDEFLDLERARGNILSASDPAPSINRDKEDNHFYDTVQVYNDRAWDEFKDNNPRGSGNLHKRG